ncbi:MAG: hypothetical protein BGN83_03330 [Rhizobium sp. 63-7]|nr:MAG: hypothetical protein BGN83_03330 [Rhizobium sp. 63-7]
MNSRAEPSEKTNFALLLQFDMQIDGFSSNWAYCDRLSSFVARMIGHNRTDSLLYSNLFSSAFNELLETAFRIHGRGGDFVCRVWRNGPTDRIELTIPCDDELGAFYNEAVTTLAADNLAERYHAALFSEGPLQPSIGLMELAVDYNARLSIAAAGDRAIQLVAELSLEDVNQ